MIDDEIAVMCAALVARLSPTRIYLFGSFAEGKGTADSDIDIYIVVPDTDTDIAGITTTAYKAIRHMIQRPVNILVSTVSYFEHHKSIPSVECEVYRKGKLLYDTACKVQPERLYCFLQDDKSAKFIYRRRKPYLGTLDEIIGLVRAIESDPAQSVLYSDFIESFKAYMCGDFSVTRKVTSKGIPLFMSVQLLHSEHITYTAYEWLHSNLLGLSYSARMRCDKVDCDHYWVNAEGMFFRCVKARFTNLAYKWPSEQWSPLGDTIWGFPYMIEHEPPIHYNRLAEEERSFDSESKAESDWLSFKENPVPVFTDFCNDIFGWCRPSRS